MTRDAWSDAHVAATQEFLEGDLVAVRRRIWLRGALRIVLGIAVVGTAVSLLDRVVDPFTDDLWSQPASVSHAGLGLAVVGFVVLILGNVRASASGVKRPFVGPDDFLSRADRTWLRAQVAEDRPVPDERHAVAAAVARRMVAESLFPQPDLGLALFFIGMGVASASAGIAVPFAVFAVWVLVRMVRAAIWGHRARRWLAQHDEDRSSPGAETLS